MTNQLQIRMAGIHEAEIISAIVRTSHQDVAQRFHLTAENCPKHPSHCTAAWIEADMDRGVTYSLLLDANGPIGCVAVEHANAVMCYIERLSVLPDYRKQGCGEALVMHAMDAARALNVKAVGIGIIAEFTELKVWYEKLGFVPGETREFSHLPFRVQRMSCTLA
jgi:N-acetylglutamate synthase-like GNAT family acetyltransferase